MIVGMGGEVNFDPPEMQLRRVLDKLGSYTERGGNYHAHCPAHDDNKPSLDLTVKDGKFLMICRSRGCAADDIVAKLGLTWPEIFTGTAPHANGNGKAKRGKSALGKIVA